MHACECGAPHALCAAACTERVQTSVTDNSPANTANGFGSDNNISSDLSTEQLLMSMSPSNEDYYPTVVINALMKILRDPSLSAHHNAVTQVRFLRPSTRP